VSILLALLGAYHPWPPAYEQEANKDPIASLVTNPLGGNAAAFLAEHAPDSRVTEALGSRFISRSKRERDRYLAYFFWSKGDEALTERFLEEASRS
jgi:hypothetical protein